VTGPTAFTENLLLWSSMIHDASKYEPSCKYVNCVSRYYVSMRWRNNCMVWNPFTFFDVSHFEKFTSVLLRKVQSSVIYASPLKYNRTYKVRRCLIWPCFLKNFYLSKFRSVKLLGIVSYCILGKNEIFYPWTHRAIISIIHLREIYTAIVNGALY
jgi:hypothetical protein